MTIDEARKLAAYKADESEWGFSYTPGDTTVCVDGWFTADDLEALAMVMREDQRMVADGVRVWYERE